MVNTPNFYVDSSLGRQRFHYRPNGFTLLELLVVMVIVGILAFASIGAVSSGEALVRAQAFGLMTDFNLARAEAIKRNQEVLVELLVEDEVDDDGVAASADSYRICLDDDADGNCDSDDTLIKEERLVKEVRYYAADLPVPVGPNRTVDGDPWPPAQDGISFTGNRFAMRSDGTGNKAGTVYVFAPGGRKGASGGPLAVVLNRIGRIRITKWRSDSLTWQSK